MDKFNTFKDMREWLLIAKPEWNTSDITTLDYQEKTLLIDIVKEEAKELEVALNANDTHEVLDAVVDLVWVAMNSITACGITLVELEEHFKKVSTSNWSKYCKSEEEAEDTVAAYAMGLHPSKPNENIECRYRQRGDQWIVYRRKDLKIMKSIAFIEPK